MINQKNKKLLCEFVDYKCEICKNKFEIGDLHAHRIRRGCEGGTYEFRNIKIVCHTCHKKLHQNEFRNVRVK